MERKLKILYLRTFFWLDVKSGGAVTHTKEVIKFLGNKVDLDVVSNENLSGVKRKIRIVKPIFAFLPVSIKELIYNVKIIAEIGNSCKKYDAIYQRHSANSFCGAWLAKKYSIPFILEYNSSEVWKIKNRPYPTGGFFGFIKKIYRALIQLKIVKSIELYNLKGSSLIVAVSKALKEDLIERGIEENKIIVVPMSVDIKSFNPNIWASDIKERYGIKNENVVGFCGTFGRWHGIMEIVKAVNAIFEDKNKKYKNVKFMLIGDGFLLEKARNILSESDNIGRVIFTGMVSHEDMPKYLSICDILLSPSIKNEDNSEFFQSPTKIFEYMASGKSIIASRIGQIEDILEHEKTALLIDQGNVVQLSSSIIRLLSDSELREKLGKNARDNVERNYTWEKHVDKIICGINKIVGNS